MKADARLLENAALQYHIDNEIKATGLAWPVTDEVDPFTIDGFDADEIVGDGDVYAIDADAIKPFVRSLHNDGVNEDNELTKPYYT